MIPDDFVFADLSAGILCAIRNNRLQFGNEIGIAPNPESCRLRGVDADEEGIIAKNSGVFDVLLPESGGVRGFLRGPGIPACR